MVVRSLTVPGPPGLSEPIVITEPPFSATGTTDKPFLASVTIEWAGSTNKPTHMEHFVDVRLPFLGGFSFFVKVKLTYLFSWT